MTPEDARQRVEDCVETTLSLDDVQTLDEATAEVLAQFKGHLSFPALTTLLPDVAEILVAPRDDALLFNLDEGMPDAVTAIPVPGDLRRALFLNGLEVLTPDLARILTRHNDDLYLNGITRLSVEAATLLATHTGRLSLDGLTRLPVDVATALAAYKGELSFGGLASLADPDAAAPQNAPAAQDADPFFIFAAGPRSLVEVLSRFQAHAMHLDGLQTLEPWEAEYLSANEWHLSLNGLETLEPGVAERLAACAGKLDLHNIAALSVDDILDFACDDNQCAVDFGDAFLSAVIDETREVYRIWDECREDDSEGTWFNITRPYGLCIECDSLTADEARILGQVSQGIWQRLGEPRVRFSVSLELPNLTLLRDDVAIELATHRGSLCLDALESLSDAAAVSLAQHDGPLSLKRVTSVSVYQAQVLAEHRHHLELTGLESLDYHEALALAKGRSAPLNLGVVDTLVSAEVYSLLQENPHITFTRSA